MKTSDGTNPFGALSASEFRIAARVMRREAQEGASEGQMVRAALRAIERGEESRAFKSGSFS